MARDRKRQSRADRWRSVSHEIGQDLELALNSLADLMALQEEFEAWKDNLPESFRSTALGEKLETICELDLADVQRSLEDARTAMEEAEETDVPLGFGRD